MKKIFLLLCVLISLDAAAQWTLKDFSNLYPLTGSWKLSNKKGVLHETWTKTSDSTMNGYSYLVTATDSIPQETMELWFMNGKITFTPTTVSQNEGNPVTFTLAKIDNGKYIFENKAHDFPSQIIYHPVDNKTLNAAINGTIEGKFMEIPFNFSREK